jgi:hypothetical protein
MTPAVLNATQINATTATVSSSVNAAAVSTEKFLHFAVHTSAENAII